MLQRFLEPEVMDSESEAVDYDSMDHREVNARFVSDFLALQPDVSEVLDLGTGTAQIPIELCRVQTGAKVLGIDLAQSMLVVGRRNVEQAGLADRVHLERVDAKGLPYADGRFSAVMSNSIVHHIPHPQGVLAEMVRVAAAGAVLFVRDLLRPTDLPTLTGLVEIYAAGANAHQRQMFADSLHAALSLTEIRSTITALGFAAESVQQTTDRHWTWAARK